MGPVALTLPTHPAHPKALDELSSAHELATPVERVLQSLADLAGAARA
jgi:hypothetical protein